MYVTSRLLCVIIYFNDRFLIQFEHQDTALLSTTSPAARFQRYLRCQFITTTTTLSEKVEQPRITETGHSINFKIVFDFSRYSYEIIIQYLPLSLMPMLRFHGYFSVAMWITVFEVVTLVKNWF